MVLSAVIALALAPQAAPAGIGGAVLGSYAMGPYPEWVEIYPGHAAARAGSGPAQSPE